VEQNVLCGPSPNPGRKRVVGVFPYNREISNLCSNWGTLFDVKESNLGDQNMKKVNHRLIYLLLFVSVVAASCSTGNRIGGTSKKCGCGLNKGYVGY
jgi:hypothetical protein